MLTFNIVLKLSITFRLQLTKTGQQFLLFDDPQGPGRIQLFSTQSNLDILAENHDWYMDGTFKTTPNPFFQLYTIHGFRMHSSMPSVYALLPNKNEDTYRRLFMALNGLREGLAPRSILVDFEMAAINAARALYPGSDIRGCYFHFQQSLWRKIQALNALSER
jgi:hypothetical protein